MFVFKAAVVGAGTMGGEIAQVVASAGIPVVLKDVKQELVDLGLKKAEDAGKKVNLKVTHEKGVASKIEFQKKKKAAQ